MTTLRRYLAELREGCRIIADIAKRGRDAVPPPTPCDECDRIGPDLPWDVKRHERHRTAHDLDRAIYDLALELVHHWRRFAVITALVLLAAAIWGR